MPVIKELIRTEDNGTISFGNYGLREKSKLDNYQFKGDEYKVKTFKEITKLERNGLFVYESVPGSTVYELSQENGDFDFYVESYEDLQITVELEEDTEYEIFVEGKSIGEMKTNLGGKLSFSLELEPEVKAAVKITKK
ncbi:MAG: endosialidase [Lachnospiraceae bacterium]